MKRPVNGLTFVEPGGSVLLRERTTRARRYSAPKPTAMLPLLDCQAIEGCTETVLMFASRETKRPIHGSAQFVRSPNGVKTPTPSVRFDPTGTIAYAFGGTNR